MRVVDLFSGIGGFSLGFERARFQIVAHVEKDANCRKLLDARWPDAVSLDDVTTAGRHNLPDCDVVVGGSPCQGFSIAGKRKGRTDERSNLTTEFVRICDELDPGIVVWENVPGVLSMPDNAFGHFLAAMVGEDEPFVRADGKSWSVAGMVVGPRRVCGWRILDAQWFGVAQRRRRVFLVGVAHGRNGGEPSIDSGIERLQKILFIEYGVQRHSPPRRESGQGVAGCLESRTDGGGFPGTDGACAGHVVPCISHTLNARGGCGRIDGESETFVPVVAATLRSASDSPACHGKTNGTDRMTLVPVAFQQNHRDEVRLINGDGAIAGALAAEAGMKQQNYVEVPVAFQGKASSTQPMNPGPIAPTLDVSKSGGTCIAFQPRYFTRDDKTGNADSCGPITAPLTAHSSQGDSAPCVAFTTEQTPKFNVDCALTLTKQSPTGGGQPQAVAFDTYSQDINKYITHTLRDGHREGTPAVLQSYKVRRLSARECERLQAFQWRCAPTDPGAWQDELGRWWSPDYTAGFSDSTRYKMLGNAVCVNVIEWIALRIQNHSDT